MRVLYRAVAADDGDGVEDAGGVWMGEGVEISVEGVEAGALVAELFFVSVLKGGPP